jgi:nucleotide sugar dehydrogenase
MAGAAGPGEPGAHEPARAPDAPLAVGVVGLGPTGMSIASAMLAGGLDVVGCDICESRLAAAKARQTDPRHDAWNAFLGTERLTLTTEPAALASLAAVVVCVSSPLDAHVVPDHSALQAACDAVVRHAVPGQTFVLASPAYVGCTRELLAAGLEERGLAVGVDVHVAFSPEHIGAADAAHDGARPRRIVGGVTPACGRRAEEVLRRTGGPVHQVSSPEAAELATLLDDSYRAVNIALANEFSAIAREFDVDPVEVVDAATVNSDGFVPFYPGPGVGGRRVPTHPHHLLWQLRALHRSAPLTEAAMASIAGRPHMVVARARELLGQAARPLTGARILVVGVAYKPGAADVRGSSAVEIIDELVRGGARVSFTDPLVESIRTAAGELVNDASPVAGAWDLAIAHTLHPGVDYSWLSGAPLVLDTTYRMPALPQRHLL